MQKQSVRLGVDIGGTFTDVVLERGEDLFSTKVLTTICAFYLHQETRSLSFLTIYVTLVTDEVLRRI